MAELIWFSGGQHYHGIRLQSANEPNGLSVNLSLMNLMKYRDNRMYTRIQRSSHNNRTHFVILIYGLLVFVSNIVLFMGQQQHGRRCRCLFFCFDYNFLLDVTSFECSILHVICSFDWMQMLDKYFIALLIWIEFTVYISISVKFVLTAPKKLFDFEEINRR